MSLYPILSALLDYPEPALLEALPEIEAALHEWPQARAHLAPLIASLKRPLIDVQLAYVATFDRNPSHSLHLFEHVHGESRDRGQAMVDLLDEYRSRPRCRIERIARLRAALSRSAGRGRSGSRAVAAR
jgi:nitrate reductase delta subunit